MNTSSCFPKSKTTVTLTRQTPICFYVRHTMVDFRYVFHFAPTLTVAGKCGHPKTEGVQVVEGVALVLFKVKTILPFRNLIFYWHFISIYVHRLYFPCLFIKLDDNDLRTLF